LGCGAAGGRRFGTPTATALPHLKPEQPGGRRDVALLMFDESSVAAGAAPALERCEERLGYRFDDRGLLVAALTHASGAQHRLLSNERLEFLGDAILGAVVCEILFRRYPDYLEGDLTRIKSVVVSRRTCTKISKSLGLQEFISTAATKPPASSSPATSDPKSTTSPPTVKAGTSSRCCSNTRSASRA
jgi:hypothetical protein